MRQYILVQNDVSGFNNFYLKEKLHISEKEIPFFTLKVNAQGSHN